MVLGILCLKQNILWVLKNYWIREKSGITEGGVGQGLKFGDFYLAGKTFSEIKNLFEEIWKSFYFGNLCKFHLDAYMIFFSLKRKRNKKLP